jgi:Potato inhibitor I family
MDCSIAIAVIQSERPDLIVFDVIRIEEDDDPDWYNTTQSITKDSYNNHSRQEDYRSDRVRLYVNEDQIVMRIPNVG